MGGSERVRKRSPVSGSNGFAAADDGSSSAPPSRATNGNVRRRRRKQGGVRPKKSWSWLLIPGTVVGFLIVACVVRLSAQSRFDDQLLMGDSSTNVRRILSDMPDDAPLTEEQEQEIIGAYRSDLDRFPVSVGADDHGSNPGWETIVHPSAEVETNAGRKKKTTAAELAGLLAGKALRGGFAKADGDDGDYMRVPKFWDPPPYRTIADERERRSGADASAADDLPRDGVRRYLGDFGSRLMTPAEAKSIGSRVPSGKGDGEMLETIFVAIASYRDWQCSSTVEGAFSRASHPERIRVAVVDQIRRGEDKPCSVPPDGPCEQFPDQHSCKFRSQIDYFTVDADLSVGPVFARHLGHRLYRGEYFAMQSDAHVAFVVGWDDEIIEQWHSAKNDMAVLSNYLSNIEDHIDLKTGERISKARPIMCQSGFEGFGAQKHLRHGQQPEGIPHIREPTLDPFWAAGFSFGRGHFVVNVPYDQHLPWVFQGEEISIGLRGFSYGYDYYSAERSVCYHFYGREGVPLFWENDHPRGTDTLAMRRLNSIIRMNLDDDDVNWLRTDELKYGIGKVRNLQTFFDAFGIHVEDQEVEAHLCRFVGKPMQKEFLPSLRSNGMGIDYNNITYRFVDKWKNEEDDDG
ncbi:hypothetical protein ACHAWF_006557 [Thalassiosira exigua]